MIKEFFKMHPELTLELRRTNVCGEGWYVKVCAPEYDLSSGLFSSTVFERYILDEFMDNTNVSFEAAIMIPIISWWENREKREENL